MAVAAVDYRAVRLEAAVTCLQNLDEIEIHLVTAGTRRYLLAMALQRLGRTPEARQELSSATKRVTKALGAVKEIPAAGHWHDTLRVQLLRREAEALILDPGFPADPFAP